MPRAKDQESNLCSVPTMASQTGASGTGLLSAQLKSLRTRAKELPAETPDVSWCMSHQATTIPHVTSRVIYILYLIYIVFVFFKLVQGPQTLRARSRGSSRPARSAVTTSAGQTEVKRSDTKVAEMMLQRSVNKRCRLWFPARQPTNVRISLGIAARCIFDFFLDEPTWNSLVAKNLSP